jgi:hypothetical protein
MSFSNIRRYRNGSTDHLAGQSIFLLLWHEPCELIDVSSKLHRELPNIEIPMALHDHDIPR